MPTTPYAQVTAAVNGGAPSSGLVTVPASATVQLSAANKSGWQTAVWTMIGPPGWSVPAGWTDNGGVATYSGATEDPPVWTAPAITGWGKWMVTLVVNGTVKLGAAGNVDLTDTATVLEMDSTNGVKDVGTGEAAQASALRAWLAPLQANLRRLETALSVASGAYGSAYTAPGPASGWTSFNTPFLADVGTNLLQINPAGTNGSTTSSRKGAYRALTANTTSGYVEAGIDLNLLNIHAGVNNVSAGVFLYELSSGKFCVAEYLFVIGNAAPLVYSRGGYGTTLNNSTITLWTDTSATIGPIVPRGRIFTRLQFVGGTSIRGLYGADPYSQLAQGNNNITTCFTTAPTHAGFYIMNEAYSSQMATCFHFLQA